ncbi:uncharacterized protein si:dkey-109l4.3 [Clupea harengus]|uniref:Uncharacterized protein si:dkey-109l4.3 n=1 Tax=Clupea harengus TaxID=7950 RepID=A0A8M1KNG9_CLUHA|nr:uncharacterized protein si:dkey-109l4.3 [Clupea harengus]
MELSNGLFSSESLNGLLQQKWRNGQGDASSTYLSNKRKRDDVGQENNGVHNGNTELRNSLFPEPSRKNRPFIHISGQKGVFFSERWEPNGSTLYLPVNGSLLTNIDKYDQISFEQGLFFIGDLSGAFQQKAQGQAIHCWRYSEQERKLFIALSYFFTDQQAFQDVVTSLGCL